MAIKYVQLEPAAYPADPDWLAMTAEERGCYHTVIVFLSCNNGKLENNPEKLRNLCNTTAEKFENFWKKFSHKFPIKNEKVTHKRVTRELSKARKLIKQRQLAGIASGQKRATLVEQPLNGNRTKAQLREGKGSKGKKGKVFIPPTLGEVKSYCIEKRLTIKPEYVWGFYEKKGWKVGKHTMKNWHIAVSQAEDWEDAPRVKIQITPEEAAAKEKAGREKRRQEIREEEGRYYNEKTTEELEAILVDPKATAARHWLIKEILEKRKTKGATNK